ncbi:MAG: FAD-dependent oxidoreductase, partial [Actinomycetota bacterium]|nr:FAD-dependent oxidoreductase [Actinomycetota bacterium]
GSPARTGASIPATRPSSPDISGTHEAHSSYRVMPTSMVTGQAAGACAALAAREGTTPRRVSVSLLQETLLHQGASLAVESPGAAEGPPGISPGR